MADKEHGAMERNWSDICGRFLVWFCEVSERVISNKWVMQELTKILNLREYIAELW